MSALVTPGPGPSSGPGASGWLARGLRAEVVKLRSTRTPLGLLLLGVALAALYALLIGLLAGRSTGGQPAAFPGLDQAVTLRQLYGAGAGFGYLVTLSLGVLVICGEYRHQTLTSTLLAQPRRGRLVVVKLLATLACGLVLGAAMVAAGALVGGITVVARGYPLGLTAAGVWRAMLLAVLTCAIWAIFGLGIGTLLRNQIAALLTAIGIGYLLLPLLSLALETFAAGKAIAPYLPSSASSAMVAGGSGSTTTSSGGMDMHLLPWWGGALVLTAYGLVLAAVGARLTLRRDVT